MEKYLAVISNSIKKNFAYKANTFIAMFAILFSFGVLFYFWASIYRAGNMVGNYSLREIVSYYVYIAIFELLITSVAWSIGEEIKNGQITGNIMRPISYIWYKFFQGLGSLVYRFILFLMLAPALFFLLKNYIVYAESFSNYWGALILLIIAFMLNFFIYFIVGISAFWTGDSFGVFFAFYVAISFMQGQWIPLDLLPKWFLMLSEYLPFKYLFFVPVGVVSGRIHFEYQMALMAFFWLFCFYALAVYLYGKGLKKYEGYGA